MTAKKITNVAASVRQRLKNIADESGRPFAEVLQWYAIERFLVRSAFLRRMRLSQEPPSLSQAAQVLLELVAPVLRAVSAGSTFHDAWTPGRGWQADDES